MSLCVVVGGDVCGGCVSVGVGVGVRVGVGGNFVTVNINPFRV